MSIIKNYLSENGYGYYNEFEFKKNFSFAYIELESDYFLFIYQDKLSNNYDFLILMIDVSHSESTPIWFGDDLTKKISRDQYIRAASFLFYHSKFCDWDTSKKQVQSQYNKAHVSIQKIHKNNNDFLYKVDNYQYSNSSQNVEIEVQGIQANNTLIKTDFIDDFELNSHGFSFQNKKTKKSAKLALCIDENCDIKALLYTKDNKLFTLSAKQLENYQIDNISKGMQSLWQNHFSSIQTKSYLKIKNEQFQYLIRHLLIEILDEINENLIYFESRNKKLKCQLFEEFQIHLSFYPCKDSGQFFELTSNILNTKFNNQNPLIFFQSNRFNFLFAPFSQSCKFIKRERNLKEDSFFKFLTQNQNYPSSVFKSIQSSLEKLNFNFLSFDKEITSRYFVKLNPTAKLILYDFHKKKELFISIEFDYKEALIQYLKQSKLDGEVSHIDNPEFEKLAKYFFLKQSQAQYKPIPTRKLKQNFHYSIETKNISSFYSEIAPILLNRGFQIYSLKNKKKLSNNLNCKLHLELKPQGKWLKFQAKIKIDEKLLNIDSFDLAEGYASDQNGIMYSLNTQDLKQLALLDEHFDDLKSPLNLPLNPLLIKEILSQENYDNIQLKTYLGARDQILKLKNTQKVEPPLGLKTKLRPYQLEGFQFLKNAHNTKYGVLLADDMGLGKTIQTLALLSTLKQEKKHQQTLIVAPVSAITNWQREFHKFCPQFTTYAHMGVNRKYNPDVDIILISYTTLRIDLHLFTNTTFTCLILDESQMIKNPSSLQTKAVKELKAKQKIALSGTPLENNTQELWSLFDFLNPRFLGTRKWFRTNFSNLIEVGKVEAKARTLKALISPMVLRRSKEVVASELPIKTEFNINLQMSDDQTTAYHLTAKYYRERIQNHFEAQGINGAGPLVLTGMMRLRQICLLPELSNKEFLGVSSCKIDYLKEVLPKIAENGHKFLIFSQFIGVLDRVKILMNELNITFSHFDGSTSRKQRQIEIDQFQENPDIKAFLISLKSGGTALNLVAADYVFLLDPWWNPAVENQAIDRAHRIGQEKPVFVYRLIVEKTIEEKIQKLQKDKQDLLDKLFTSSNTPNFHDPKDLLNFFEDIK